MAKSPKQMSAANGASGSGSGTREARDRETRRRLLDAAGEIFAEKGFKATTVREICKRAKANVAAVNYHFRDKEELYHAVFEEAGCVVKENMTPEVMAAMGPGRPPHERLHAFVRQYLFGVLGPGRPAWQGKLMAREMMEPTGALDRMVEVVIRPQAQIIGAIVSEITGLPIGDDRLWYMAASVVGQCLFYKHAQPVIARLRPNLKHDAETIEALAEHITAFSWTGLMGLKSDVGAVRKNEKKRT